MIHLIMIDDDGLIVQTYNSSKVQNQSESESQTQANKMEEIFKMNGKATQPQDTKYQYQIPTNINTNKPQHKIVNYSSNLFNLFSTAFKNPTQLQFHVIANKKTRTKKHKTQVNYPVQDSFMHVCIYYACRSWTITTHHFLLSKSAESCMCIMRCNPMCILIILSGIT